MAAIESFRVVAVQITHSAGEVRDGSFDEQMVVVGHQDEGMNNPAADLDGTDEQLEESAAVEVRAIDVLALIPALSDMPDGAGIFETKRPGQSDRNGERGARKIVRGVGEKVYLVCGVTITWKKERPDPNPRTVAKSTVTQRVGNGCAMFSPLFGRHGSMVGLTSLTRTVYAMVPLICDRPVMKNRGAIFLVAAIAIGGFSCPGLDDLTARSKIDAGLQQVKVGMSPSQVKEILGPPTLEESPVSEIFRSKNNDCRTRTTSAFIYQFSSQPSLIVYFNDDVRVACVEETMAFRVIRP